MTPADFIAKHGPAWKAFESSDLGVSLFRLIEDQHPVRVIPQDADNLRLVGAPVLLNHISGYEALASLLRKLGAEPKIEPPKEEEDFSEPEIR